MTGAVAMSRMTTPSCIDSMAGSHAKAVFQKKNCVWNRSYGGNWGTRGPPASARPQRRMRMSASARMNASSERLVLFCGNDSSLTPHPRCASGGSHSVQVALGWPGRHLPTQRALHQPARHAPDPDDDEPHAGPALV